MLESVKKTMIGEQPLVGVPEKFATGAWAETTVELKQIKQKAVAKNNSLFIRFVFCQPSFRGILNDRSFHSTNITGGILTNQPFNMY